MKEKVHHLMLITTFLCALVIHANAQSFDLRPQTTQSKKADESVQTLLDRNDVVGMKAYLKKNKQAANSNSRVVKLSNGSKESIPLFFDAVQRALSDDGSGSAEMCQVIIDAGCDLHPVCEGTTPIYLVMNYIATHEKGKCGTALKILQAFGSRSDWDANQRYRSNLPPINHLIRKNYWYLNNHFSKDYIADEVLKILIEHGASVTSYTDEGQTLMTFALETDNHYLQSYFADKGVNLTHNDDSGRDDLYRMIDSGNLALLKKLVQNGGVNVTVRTVKNDYNSLRHHKDMFDYVANICAQNANNYDDLKLFRERFAEKKSLVDAKYQEACRKEADAATDFDAICSVMQRYPDLTSVTASKRLSIYRKDAAEMEQAYRTALSNGKNSNFNMVKDNRVSRFIDRYSVKTQYDPDNKLSIAQETDDFYTLCHALTTGFSKYITVEGFKMKHFFGIPIPSFSNRPAWNSDEEAYDRKMIERGTAVLEKGSKHGFANIYQQAKERLESRMRDLLNWKNSQQIQLREAIAEYDRKKEESERQRAQLNRDAEKAKDILEKVDDWGEWSKGRFFDTDYSFTDSRTIKFKNDAEVKVFWNYEESREISRFGFMPDSSMIWYNSFEDAVIAAYLSKYKRESWPYNRYKER